MRDTWDKLVGVIAGLGRFTQLISDVFVVSFRRPPSWTLTRDQLYNIGVMSLPVVAITGFSTGLILATQAWFQLSDLGLAGATGLMVGKSMVTELGPVLTAFMVTGRVGASMCAELGTMQVSEQIDALRSMAVNPLRYLVAPRFIAGSLMLPPLTVFSMVMGIIGGYLIAVYFFWNAPHHLPRPDAPAHHDLRFCHWDDQIALLWGLDFYHFVLQRDDHTRRSRGGWPFDDKQRCDLLHHDPRCEFPPQPPPQLDPH